MCNSRLLMLKPIFIIINVILIALSTFFNLADITITHTSANELDAGEKIEATITINKMDFSGPGRLKLDLSQAEGVQIIEKENDGSSFTFKNNEALFIWYDLPNNKNIEITYVIDAGKNSFGTKKITGTFSFINKNERKQLTIPELVFLVNEVIPQGGEPSVSSNRTIEGKNGNYTVKIHITKGKHSGFARIKDKLPEGYIATSIEPAGSIFKDIDGSAKFIWSDLPSSIESFTVSYRLINPKAVDTSFFITGEYASERLIAEGHNDGIEIPITYYTPSDPSFEYNALTNDTSSFNEISELVLDSVKEINAEQDSNRLNVKTEDVSITLTDSMKDISIQEIDNNLFEEDTTSKSVEIPEEEIIVAENVEILEEEIIVAENVDNKTNTSEEEKSIISNIVNSQKIKTNIDYRVQILASHRIATKNYVKNKYHFSENFDLENHDGWIKYTTGRFDQYKNARNKRNDLNSNEFPGPFVTAYNFGQRITVQEALIISKQNWIP